MRTLNKIPQIGIVNYTDFMSVSWELWIIQSELDMIVFLGKNELEIREKFKDLVSQKREIHSEIRRMIGIYPDNMIETLEVW